jgi:hypothetical protein
MWFLMNLKEVRLYYVLLCLGLVCIVLSPIVFYFFNIPSEERFSEIFILGADHTINSLPFNVSMGTSYTVFVNVGNHIGNLEYYAVYAKFRSLSEALPDVSSGQPSPLQPVFEYHMFLGDNMISERRFDFSLEEISFNGDECRVSQLLINGHLVNVDQVVLWDSEDKGFFYQLFFELWVYDSAISDFRFDNRYVQFWINATRQL